MSGTTQMQALAAALEVEVRDACDDLGVAVHGELVRRTPRASGEAQAGWTVSAGAPSAEPPTAPYRPETPYRPESKAEIRGRLAGRSVGADLFVSNAVDHVPAIERRRPFVAAALSSAASKSRRNA